MKIYSWNMLFRNQELDRAFIFIRDSEWDIFCLQEVPEEFLTRLRTLSIAIAATTETDREFAKERSTQYVVILSRHPIQTFQSIPVPSHYHDILPLRTKLFTRLMFGLRLWGKGVGDRHALLADIETSMGPIQVFNMHLPLLNPTIRLAEFEMTMLKRDRSRSAIVCGDFNLVEKPHITILNFLLGGSLGDMFLYNRERKQLEERFSQHQLINPLKSQNTHPLSHSQLDHILVSDSFSIKNADVIQDRYGSDHCPIRAEVT